MNCLGWQRSQFDVFVTADQNLQYQQNLGALPLAIAVLVARDNRFQSLLAPAQELVGRLDGLEPKTLLRCEG